MQRSERHNTILDLIGAKQIGRQDELVRLLSERGFAVTQASVSRDLDELGVVKINGTYARPESRGIGFPIDLLSLNAAGPHMIVGCTAPGLASASAVRIDAARIEGIVGTIAGDDTIFIAVAGEKAQRRVTKELWDLFKRV